MASCFLQDSTRAGKLQSTYRRPSPGVPPPFALRLPRPVVERLVLVQDGVHRGKELPVALEQLAEVHPSLVRDLIILPPAPVWGAFFL